MTEGEADPRTAAPPGRTATNGTSASREREDVEPAAERAAPAAPTAASGRAAREPPQLVLRLRARRESYRQSGLMYRVAWVTAGLLVVIAGLLMVIFPGPALLVIPIGLAMLSLEFAWAERLLDTALERGVDAKELAAAASRKQKIAGVAAVVCLIAAGATAAAFYLL